MGGGGDEAVPDDEVAPDHEATPDDEVGGDVDEAAPVEDEPRPVGDESKSTEDARPPWGESTPRAEGAAAGTNGAADPSTRAPGGSPCLQPSIEARATTSPTARAIGRRDWRSRGFRVAETRSGVPAACTSRPSRKSRE